MRELGGDAGLVAIGEALERIGRLRRRCADDSEQDLLSLPICGFLPLYSWRPSTALARP